MDGIIKIEPIVKDYPWGNDYYIANLLGMPKDGPKAELWVGAHKSGSSLVDCACGACNGNCCRGQSVIDFINANPSFLDIGDASNFPFLLKILAIGGSLSLQCHPTKEQAKQGFEAERKVYREDSSKDSPSKDYPSKEVVFNYQDPNPKAEMLYALTPVVFMCGFRSFEDIKNNFIRVVPNLWARYFSQIGTIKEFFHTLYSLPKDVVLLTAKEVSSKQNLLDDLQKEVFNEIFPKYSDSGVFSPLFLNVSKLEPGQAVYLKPCVIHAYVKGNGVELMNNSDNVLRAGLTSKHMDVNELEHIMSDEPYYPNPMKSETTQEGIRFSTPNGFALTVMKQGKFEVSREGVKLFLCTSGNVLIGDLEVSQGQCSLAGVDAKSFKVDASDGCVFMASN